MTDELSISQKQYELATILRERADRWTELRGTLAYIVGPAMAIDGPSWPLFGVAALAGISDYYDGLDGKKSDKILGITINNKASDKDHVKDKEYTYMTMGGVIARDLIEGHFGSAVFVGATMAVDATRNHFQAQVRQKARDEKKSVGAIEINRWKGALLLALGAVAVSPAGNTSKGRWFRNLGLGSTVALGIKGHFDFRKHLEQAPSLEEPS